MNDNINNQGGATIVKLHPSKKTKTRIYRNEQRATIVKLISRSSGGTGKTVELTYFTIA